MIRHPGGLTQTKEWVEASPICPPSRILDLGAGDGETVRLLSGLGFDALGIDLEPGEGVEKGNFFHTPYPDGSFDAVISECALFCSGNRRAGIGEAARLLRKRGTFLYADVWFEEEKISELLEEYGFKELRLTDITQKWQEYYIQSIWNGTMVMPECDIPKKKCMYYLIVCRKG